MPISLARLTRSCLLQKLAERGMRPYYAFRQTGCVRADRGQTANATIGKENHR